MASIDSTKLFQDAVADIKYQGNTDNISGKAKAFGHNWFVARLEFARAGLEAIVDAVYHAALTLFRVILAAGTLFLNKDLRDQAWSSFQDLGTNLETLGKSAVGVICPHVAKWLDEKLHAQSSPQPEAQNAVVPPVVQQPAVVVEKKEEVIILAAPATV